MLCAHEGAEGREREKKISLIYLLASEIPTTVRIGPGQNQEPGTALQVSFVSERDPGCT